eukprot:TRINITY_DN859_c0_g1_i12.p1 TRINITY_DN859_c0_g1~~TRINITY_DN859_c0_g1_i12.p1  ORF type:complete len:315 (+),score=74.88 TRINITY_DN859_c0_g1_i12:25-945(+)
MATRERFDADLSRGLLGKSPTELLKIFAAENVKEMMQKAKVFLTSYGQMLAEAPAYLGGISLLECRQWVAANKDSLSLPEECIFAIHVYSRNDVYAMLNKMLRETANLDLVRVFCICLVKGLSLLPTCAHKCFRGIGKAGAAEAKAAIKQGTIWIWQAFSSTSVMADASAAFSQSDNKFRFVIQGVYGRNISAFSQYPDEKEVLFVPGTQMRVLEVSDTECILQEHLVSNVTVQMPLCVACKESLLWLEAKFCSKCGTNQQAKKEVPVTAKLCVTCGTALPVADAKFCNNCGANQLNHHRKNNSNN